jgi:cation transport ATPase
MPIRRLIPLGGVLRDHICTATTEWSAELESLRPANARVVAAEEDSGATVPTELIIVGAVVLVVAGASVLAFRRR